MSNQLQGRLARENQALILNFSICIGDIVRAIRITFVFKNVKISFNK